MTYIPGLWQYLQLLSDSKHLSILLKVAELWKHRHNITIAILFLLLLLLLIIIVFLIVVVTGIVIVICQTTPP